MSQLVNEIGPHEACGINSFCLETGKVFDSGIELITFFQVGEFTFHEDEFLAHALVVVVEGDERTMALKEFVVWRVVGSDVGVVVTGFAGYRGVWSGSPVVERGVTLVKVLFNFWIKLSDGTWSCCGT